MTIPATNISLSGVQNEFGGVSPIGISEYYGVTSVLPTSGQISFSNFQNQSASIYWTGPSYGGSTVTGTWVVPPGVHSIGVLCVRAGFNAYTSSNPFGGGITYNPGSGGYIGYCNNIAVTPGETLTYTIGPPQTPPVTLIGTKLSRGASLLISQSTGPTGFVSHSGHSESQLGGGAAAGYSSDGNTGTGGAPASGSRYTGGGGLGIFGEGTSGTPDTGQGGSGGSASSGTTGGDYGGGGTFSSGLVLGYGGKGALRIIWGAKTWPSNAAQ